MESNKQKYIEVSVKGLNPELWKSKRGALIEKLSQAVDRLMDKIIDPISGTTIREESEKIISLGLNHIKSSLAKTGIQNEKVLVEIQELYAKIEEITIKNRKHTAEAEAQEFKNFLNNLDFSLGSTKLLLKQEKDGDSILFIKQIDEWIQLIKKVKENYI